MKIINTYCFLSVLSCIHGVLSDRNEDNAEQVLDHIKAQQNGEQIENQVEEETDLEGRGNYAAYKRLPSGNIFRNHNARALTCGGTYDVSYARTIYFKMNSKSSMCYHAFVGSRYGKCKVAILCDGWIEFAKPSEPDAGCDVEALKIYDGSVGLMAGCGKFRFKDTPRYARNNGTDLYIYFQGSSPQACAVFCLEDVTRSHDFKKPKPITSYKTFHGFELEPSCKCGKRRDFGRVVGGEDALQFEFPWLTAIVWRNARGYQRIPFCGGSLINDRYVITAAHCFMIDGIKPWDIQLLLHAHVMDPRIKRGTQQDDPMYRNIPGWDLPKETDESEESIRVDVEEMNCHPHFNQDTFDWDVCILKLAQRINLKNKKVTPICLPLISEVLNYADGSYHVVAGWGRPAENAVAIARLPQKLDVPFVNHRQCEDLTVPAKRHMCAGYTSGKGDACSGDSGGPLIYKFKPEENQYVLTGITSAGEGCARRGRVGVYTDTQEIIQWVYHHTGDGIWCER